MDKQISLSYLADELAQVRTKKKEFLAQIEQIIPWGDWEAIIRPCYYKGERGNKPYELNLMLHLHILQNLYNLSDEATAAEVIDSRAFSEFCGVDSSNQVPDGDTIGRFRNILVKNGLQEKLFLQVVNLLTERGLILKKGTIVDSTLIAAPPSIKNREKKRDPDAHSVKKGNTWHFGYKAHVGVEDCIAGLAAPDLALKAFGDLDDGEAVARVHRALGLVEIRGIADDLYLLTGIDVAHKLAGELRAVIVDHHHRHIAGKLGGVYQRVEHGIGDREQNKEYEYALIMHGEPELRCKRFCEISYEAHNADKF